MTNDQIIAAVAALAVMLALARLREAAALYLERTQAEGPMPCLEDYLPRLVAHLREVEAAGGAS